MSRLKMKKSSQFGIASNSLCQKQFGPIQKQQQPLKIKCYRSSFFLLFQKQIVPFLQNVFLPIVTKIFQVLNSPVDERDQVSATDKRMLQRSYFSFISTLVNNNVQEVLSNQGKNQHIYLPVSQNWLETQQIIGNTQCKRILIDKPFGKLKLCKITINTGGGGVMYWEVLVCQAGWNYLFQHFTNRRVYKLKLNHNTYVLVGVYMDLTRLQSL